MSGRGCECAGGPNSISAHSFTILKRSQKTDKKQYSICSFNFGVPQGSVLDLFLLSIHKSLIFWLFQNLRPLLCLIDFIVTLNQWNFIEMILSISFPAFKTTQVLSRSVTFLHFLSDQPLTGGILKVFMTTSGTLFQVSHWKQWKWQTKSRKGQSVLLLFVPRLEGFFRFKHFFFFFKSQKKASE